MAEAKSRRDVSTPRTMRPRPKPVLPPADDVEGAPAPDTAPGRQEAVATEAPPERPRPEADEDGYAGFDEEINNRYEEIKRGGTHISELQQMTMPQLLKTAKDEGITEYTGLKK